MSLPPLHPRPCEECGEPPEPRWLDAADHRRGYTWAADDGHAYRPMSWRAFAERAIAERDALAKALRPFVEAARGIDFDHGNWAVDEWTPIGNVQACDIKAARAALARVTVREAQEGASDE